MKKVLCILLLSILITVCVWAENPPAFTGWKQADTDHFTFVFEEASRQAAEAYARIADDAYNKIADIYSLPQEKITVYVVGRANIENAMTACLPDLYLVMYTTPFTIPVFTYRDDLLTMVFTHELIHAANMAFESRNNFIADIFGSYFNQLDFAAINSWEHEGLTTVLETELSKAGRGRSPYFEICYKARAMEGSLLRYNEIGLNAVPPYNQQYVYGYLMMRSIADRWGIGALADIERNRPTLGSFEDAMLAVTGVSAPDLWAEIKIALSKRYAQERLIPEGQLLSPRDKSYNKPAAILEDGSIITLRTTKGESVVVLLSPSLPSGQRYFDELPDGVPVTKETILFAADVQDELAVTADKNGRVYASLAMKRTDRAPGEETEYQIFTWDKENGLRQLTSGSSYFEPSVSYDGSTLVALEQVDLHMRLVQIDLATGEATPLLDDAAYDFAMPSVNRTGTQVAMLRIGGGRAAVATLDLAAARRSGHALNASSLTVVANGEGDIIDPAYPSWNADDTLTYCSNDRGRLEVYSVTDNGDGTFTSTPVVSDPVAALWTWKTSSGVYYGSYGTSGYSIKIKPVSEWGVIPDWNGPSAPNEVICLGDLEEDYKGFAPYTNGDQQEFTKRNKSQYVNGLTVREPVTELQNERSFTMWPTTIMRLPLVTVATLPEDKLAVGFGIAVIGMSPVLPGSLKVAEADLEFYPEIMNFGGNAGFENQINSSLLDMFVSRQLATDDRFNEINTLMAGFTTPFYSRSTPVSALSLYTITNVVGGITRSAAKPFSVADSVSTVYSLSFAAGLGLRSEKYNATLTDGFKITSSAVGFANWDDAHDKLYYGAEADVDVQFGASSSGYAGLYLQGRYLDAPASLSTYGTTMKHGGKRVGFTYPTNVLARLESVASLDFIPMSSICVYEEGLCSFSKSGAFVFDDILASGLELSIDMTGNSLAAGMTVNYSLKANSFSFGGMYFTLKLNFVRM